MMDRRVTLARGDVAAQHLRGAVKAADYIAPTPMAVAPPVVDILHAPDGRRERQAVLGTTVNVIWNDGIWAFGQAGGSQGYVGYMPMAALAPQPPATHWVTAICGHGYADPDFKSPNTAWLPFGAQITVTGVTGNFAQTPHGFVPKQHIAPLAQRFDDPAQVALKFLGTPYLWGGNSPSGVDCSGLVHTALAACGLPCPPDADLQEQHFAQSPRPGQYARNQLLFWRGHVAMTLDDTRLIHANAHAMMVSIEPITDAITRIKAAGDGPVTHHVQI